MVVKSALKLFSNTLIFAFGGVWIGGWSLGTLVFDGVLIFAIVSGLLSLSYPSTLGVVTASSLKVESDSEGTSYKAIVEYDYTVGGQKYHSDNLRWFDVFSTHSSATATVAKHPPGKQVTVHYHPRKPASAMLIRGIDGSHGFMALFLLPFNIIMVGSQLTAYRWLRTRSPDRLPEGASARMRDFILQVQLYSVTPLTAAGISALGISFLGVFLVGFGSWLLPLDFLLITCWIVLLIAAVYVYRSTAAQALLLEIDEFHDRLTLRRRADIEPIFTGPLSGVTAVRIEETKTTDSEGATSLHYQPVLLCSGQGIGSDGKGLQEIPLVGNWGQAPAEQLVGWLRQRLKLRGN